MSVTFWNYSQKLLKHSIVTGLPQIVTAKGIKRKFIKVLVFLVCVFGFLYQTFSFLRVYWSYPTVVYITSGRDTVIYMPGITVCSHNGINGSMFCELFPKKCKISLDHSIVCNNSTPNCRKGDKHPLKLIANVTAHELPEVPREVYRRMGLNADEIIENCVIHIDEQHIPCSTQYEWVPVFDLRGIPNNCYVINSLSKNRAATRRQIGRKTEVVLTLKGTKEDLFNERIPHAYQLSLHDARTVENPFLTGVTLDKCFDYFISISKIRKTFQPAPYSTNCTDYEKLWHERGGFGPLDKTMCIEECFLNASLKLDGCVNPCDIVYPTDALTCKGTLDFDKTFKVCNTDVCNSACNFEKLELDVNKLNIDPSTTPDVRNCSTIIKLIWDKMQEHQYIYMPKYERIELFSYIGGYLGVWLGISLIAVLDFLECVTLIVRFLIVRRKKISHSEKIKQIKSQYGVQTY